MAPNPRRPEKGRVSWNQALCEPCYAAFSLGKGEPPRTPSRVVDAEPDPCLVCSTPTTIYVRISPELAEHFGWARREAPDGA